MRTESIGRDGGGERTACILGRTTYGVRRGSSAGLESTSGVSVRHSRYFARLISDMNKYHRARLLLLAVVSVSGGGSFVVPNLPGYVSVAAGFAVAVFSVWIILADHSQRLATVKYVSRRFQEIEVDVRDCWVLIEDGRIDNESAHRRWNDAERAINDAVEDWKASGMSINNRLNERSEEESVRLVKEEFSYAA